MAGPCSIPRRPGAADEPSVAGGPYLRRGHPSDLADNAIKASCVLSEENRYNTLFQDIIRNPVQEHELRLAYVMVGIGDHCKLPRNCTSLEGGT
jgi:hypothetical protein